MNEKEIMRGELKDGKFVFLLPIIGIIIVYIYDGIYVANQGQIWHGEFETFKEMYGYSYLFGFGNDANYIFYPLIIILFVIAFVIYNRWKKVQITVTDKRVYGVDGKGKRVDLPLDSITAIGAGWFNSLTVNTPSGAISFAQLKNRDDLHDAISKLIIERQDKKVSSNTTTITKEVSPSNADELKKFKELLDAGIITQEEFDAKKKQLLGL